MTTENAHTHTHTYTHTHTPRATIHCVNDGCTLVVQLTHKVFF